MNLEQRLRTKHTNELRARASEVFDGYAAAAILEDLPLEPATDLPKVVTLCGSTRFWAELAEANLQETAAGHVVLAPACNLKTSHDLWATPEQAGPLKERLDRLHHAKIGMADEVLVVNPGGYIGTSTRAEIDHATVLGIPVRYTDEMPTDPHTDHPAAVYADAGELEAEFAALKAEAVGGRGLADSRALALRKAAYLDRAALILTDNHAAGRADAAKTAEAVGLAEDAALELRRFDHAFGTRLGYIPPHSRVLASGASRIYVRQEYRHWRAGDIVPVSQCDHYDNCPTTECAYGEGYFDKPEDRDPDFPIDQDHQDWGGWFSSIRL